MAKPKSKPIFYPAFGNRPDRLVGREAAVDAILDGLESYPGGPGRATFIVGQRGMGKTALLLEVAERARAMDFVVVRVTCGSSMLDNVIELLQVDGAHYIKDSKRPIRGFNAGALGFSVGLTFTDEAQASFGFRVKLEMLCNRLSQVGKGVLVLVDEVDPSSEEMRTLATTYQELAGEEKNIAIVMAGLPAAVSRVLNYRTLTFLNRAQRIELGPIPISEVQAYYRTAFKRAKRRIDSSLARMAAETTQGLPYLLQLLGYYVVQMSQDGDPVTKDLLENAQEAAVRGLDDNVFAAMLNQLSRKDIEILQVLAGFEGAANVGVIEKQLGMTHSNFQTYRRRLIDAGVVVSLRRGELEFAMPLLADYLKRIGS